MKKKAQRLLFNGIYIKMDEWKKICLQIAKLAEFHPYAVIEAMTRHSLTDAGIAKFQDDYRKVFEE